MPGGFDGAGNYVRYYNWTQDAANSIPILASRFDTEHNGFAAGLSNCLTRDGQGKPTATIDWNAQRLTGLANANAPSDAVSQQFGDARYARSLRKMKATATSRATATSSDDPDLIIAIPGAGAYSIDFYLEMNGNGLGTQGFSFNVNYTGSMTTTPGYSGIAFANNLVVGFQTLPFGTSVSFGLNSSAPNNLRGSASLIATGAGNLSIKWAQNNLNATATILQAGSWLKAELVA